MCLEFLGRGGSDDGGCPTLYATENTYVCQGWGTDTPETIEIPHLLLGFLQTDTFMGATLTDTGRGTFTLTGKLISDRTILGMLNIADNEVAIEVPKVERTFYGAVPKR